MWSKFSFRILTKLQPRNLNQTSASRSSASKSWPKFKIWTELQPKILAKTQLQNLVLTSAEKSWINFSLKLLTKNQFQKFRPNFSHHWRSPSSRKYNHQLALSNCPHQPDFYQSSLNNSIDWSSLRISEDSDKTKVVLGSEKMFVWSFLNLCVANCTTDIFFHIDFFLHTLQVLGQSKGEVCNFSIHFLKVHTTEFMTGFRNCYNPCAMSIWWEMIPPMNHDCKKFLFLQQPYLLAECSVGMQFTKSSYIGQCLLLYNSCKMAAAPDLDIHKS